MICNSRIIYLSVIKNQNLELLTYDTCEFGKHTRTSYSMINYVSFLTIFSDERDSMETVIIWLYMVPFY